MASQDVLDSLKELDLVSIQDIQTALIDDCQPLVECGSYEQEEEDAIVAYYLSLVHLLLSSTPLGRSMTSEHCTSDDNTAMDDARWDLAKLNGMDWLQRMKRLLHRHRLEPSDFYTDFMDSCRFLRTLAPPLWVRYHQQPWNMQDKAKLLPMVNIPCIRDSPATPASLCTQDHLHLGQDNISQVTKLGQAFYATTLFDVDGIESLPTLGLKATHYTSKFHLGRHLDCYDGAVPQQTDDNNYGTLSDLYLPTLIDINRQTGSSNIKKRQTSLKQDTITDTLFNDGSKKIETSHFTLTQNDTLEGEEDYLRRNLTVIPPASSQVLVIPERRKPTVNRIQRHKGTPIKDGASGYWANSSKQPPSPTVSFFSSLFTGDISPTESTQPAIIKTEGSGSSNPTPKASDDGNGLSTSTQQPPMRLNFLSMESLSIEDNDFDCGLTEVTEHKSLTPHTASLKTIAGIKHARQSPLPPKPLVKKSTFCNNSKPPVQASSGSSKGKQKAVMPQQPPPSSSVHDLRDFLAYRKVQPVCSSDLLGASKLKRSWCDLDDPDFPAKKERWKWTTGKKP